MKGAESRVEKKEEDGNGSAKQQTPSPTGGVTLSGLLNVLDGFYAPTGVLFVMTTNHAEKLDEALLRPGRIDYKLFLGQASRYQKMELYRRFFPEASDAEVRDFVDSAADVRTMAEFQGLLLQLDQQDRELRGSLLERSA